jgi:chromosome segregation ATPase
MAVQDEVLRQLAEIQRRLGETVSTVEALREDLRNNTDDTERHREQVGQALTNTATRLGQMENDVKEVKLTMEKTIKPLVTNYSNTRQRVIGFMSAVSLGGMVIGGLWWFITIGGPALVKLLQAKNGS